MGLWSSLSFVWRHPMNRKRRLAALGRFFRWQFGSRLLPGPVGVPFANGSTLMIERGMTGATGNFYCGLHEYEDMAFVLKVLRAGDCFIDVGANVGSYTVLAASRGAAVLAFEPIRATYDRLRRNVAVNRFEGLVRAENAGVGAAKGELRFTTSLDTVNHVATEGETGPVTIVPVVPLDGVETPPGDVFVKIDVEGFEKSVLQGAAGLFASDRVKAVLMEINGSIGRYGESEADLHGDMLRFGFKPHRYDPAGNRLETLETWNTSSGNTLYLKDGTVMAERLKAAPMFEINGVRF